MSPADNILAALRAGGIVTPDMTCATIGSVEELDAYRAGLQSRGALTHEAVHAIEARRKALDRGRRA